MEIGPGKYDDLCTYVRTQSKAAGALVIVLEGTKGEGFSVQGDLLTLMQLPQILRDMADQIERSITGERA